MVSCDAVLTTLLGVQPAMKQAATQLDRLARRLQIEQNEYPMTENELTREEGDPIARQTNSKEEKVAVKKGGLLFLLF